MTPTDKRAAAVAALREIARRLEAAPLDGRGPDAAPTADAILSALMDVEPFTVVQTRYCQEGADGDRYVHCMVCDEEAHHADCPVRTLEELSHILAHDTIGVDESVRLVWS